MSINIYFILRCKSCGWAKKTTGLSDDLKNMGEIKNCAHCSGRKFKCPKCGQIVKMIRVRSNNDAN